jgi:hypothetical protein
MFFWFIGCSVLIVAWVFASPAIDYRLVALGSVLPVIEHLFDGPWFLHTLLAPVAVMAAVMVLLQGKRLQQRRWLGIPIGMFFYLVLDGAWTRTELFWWPALGTTIDDADLPSWDAVGVTLLKEAIGIVALAYTVRRFGLTDPAARRDLIRTGRLPRASMSATPPAC